MSPDTAIGAALDQLADAEPDAPAVSCGSETTTRAQLASRTNRLARLFHSEGVARGDFVTVALPTGQAFLEAVVAVWKLGATPQPVSHRLPPAELRSIVELARPRLVLGDIAVDAGVRRIGSNVRVPLSFDDGPLPPCVSPSWKAPTSGGSTGTPKLIVSTRPGTIGSVTGIAQLARIDAGTTAYIPAPLYHNGPIQYAATTLLCGGHLVLADRFDPVAALQAIEQHRATWFYAVPTMMHRLLRLGDDVLDAADLSSLRTLFHLAAPCSTWLKAAWIDRLGPERVLELYGATEGQAATMVTGDEWLDRPGTVGRAVVGEIRVCDDEGRSVDPETVGEVYLRATNGPTYTYIGAETQSIEGGWETLGDIGWMDTDGYLYLCDRATDMILVGGANVYPAEVEGALEQHPSVASACVIGLPDDDYGSTVHALVNVMGQVTDDALREHIAGLLAPYKRPRSYERVIDPLRDDTGKVRRSALRAERLGNERQGAKTG